MFKISPELLRLLAFAVKNRIDTALESRTSYKFICVTAILMLSLQKQSLGVAPQSLAIEYNPSRPRERLLSQARSGNFDLKNFNFWVGQCQVLENVQNYEEALAACERAIALKPNGKNRQIWLSRSNALLQLKQYAEAVNSYDFLLRFDAKNSQAWARRGEALYQLGKYDEAIASQEKALRVNGNWGSATPANAWYNRGLAQRKLGENETALTSFERALSINPDYALAQVERCGSLSDLGRQEAAIAACNLAIDALPAPAFTNRAIAQQRAGKILDAIASYEKALAINPNDASAWTQQGILFEKLEQNEKALTSYNKAIGIDPKSALAQVNRCATLNRLANYKEALAACESAMKGDSSWGDKNLSYAWNQHSSASIGLGQYQEALSSAERAININPNMAEAWNNKGVSLWYLQKYQDALDALQKSVEIYPNYTQAWFNAGRIFSTLKQYQLAIQAYEKALDGEINFQDNLTCNAILFDRNNLGIWLLKESEKVLESAQNYCADVLANKSVALWNLRDYRNALNSANFGIELNPKSFEAWYNLAVVLVTFKRYDLALVAYERANNISPNNFYVLTGKGLALGGLGRDREALEAFEAALNINPNYKVAQQQRDLLLEKFKTPI